MIESNDNKWYRISDKNSHMYKTHIKRVDCCGSQPLLIYRVIGKFIQEARYKFVCESCGRRGDEYGVPDGASEYWNKVVSDEATHCRT